MARKESITIDMILDTAFGMVKTDGIENVTARKVAAAAGCSTQPIFRVYKNMEELQRAVYEKSITYFLDYYKAFEKKSNVPFTNLGLAYITFAREEKNYFKLLFLGGFSGGKSMYELLNGEDGNVVKEINLARTMGCSNPGHMFMKMWIFIHGAACMTLSGDFDLTDEETTSLLEKSYESFSRE